MSYVRVTPSGSAVDVSNRPGGPRTQSSAPLPTTMDIATHFDAALRSSENLSPVYSTITNLLHSGKVKVYEQTPPGKAPWLRRY
jgi:hypothetical protein